MNIKFIPILSGVHNTLASIRRSKLALGMAAGVLVLGGAAGSELKSVNAINGQTKEIQGLVYNFYDQMGTVPNLSYAITDQIVQKNLSKTTHWYDLPSTIAAAKCKEWRMGYDHAIYDYKDVIEKSVKSNSEAEQSLPKVEDKTAPHKGYNDFLKADVQIKRQDASLKSFSKKAGKTVKNAFKEVRI